MNNETEYSNREIDRMFTEIKDLLIEIKTQTTKTNGRVSVLELWKEGLMAKISVSIAGIAIVWVLIKEFILK